MLVTVIVGVIAVTLIITLPPNAINNATQSTQLNDTMFHKTVTMNELPAYINFNNILAGTLTQPLSFTDKIKVNDYISVTNEKLYNGLYKVLNPGSMTDKWVLEKVK